LRDPLPAPTCASLRSSLSLVRDRTLNLVAFAFRTQASFVIVAHALSSHLHPRLGSTLSINKTCYVEKVSKCFVQENCKPVSIPLPIRYNPRPNPNQDESNATLHSCYQSVIGSLLYIMLDTRPDIAFVVIKMSQFSSNPMEEHLQKVLYIVHYLSSFQDLCILYSRHGDQNSLCAYSDTDLTGDVETSRSTTGYAIFLGNSIIS